MVARRGAIKLGCLVQLLVLAAIAYFGNDAGQAYYRHLKFKDVVENEMRFRSQKKSIPELRNRFRFLADSMDMPDEAGIALVRRTAKETSVEIHYDFEIIVPGFRKDVHFEIKAAGTL